MPKKTIIAIIVFIVLALIGVGVWYFYFRVGVPEQVPTIPSVPSFGSGGTNTIPGRVVQPRNPEYATSTVSSHTPPNGVAATSSVPTLRELSQTPVGGFTASSTGTTSIVRFIDRGTGHVFEANSADTSIKEISNTTVPRIYYSYWNKNATAFVFQSLAADEENIINFYTELKKVASATASNTTQFELRGVKMPDSISGIAVSPDSSNIFTLSNENYNGVGYVSQFNGLKRSQIFNSPLSSLTAEWPEKNTIALTTKATSGLPGFLYFLDPKKGVFNKIIGNLPGLTTLVSKDANQVFYTVSNGVGISSYIYTTKTKNTISLAFNTMPEKCVWSNVVKTTLYCAIPTSLPQTTYPDVWYQGSIAFTDSLWAIDTTNGQVHSIADISKLAGENIDATNLTLDPKDNFIYFINKTDLTLWSLDLNS